MAGNDAPAAVLGPVIGALVALGIARGVLRFEHEAAEHRRLVGEVLVAQEATAAAQREAGVQAERARLAHDIHDTLAQGFSSVILLARAAGREPDAARTAALIERIEATASQNLADARRVVYALAPEETSAGGLAAPLRRLAGEAADAVGATASVTIDPDLPRLGTATEVALLRVAQGALANVRAHARPGRVAVELSRSGETVRLDVVDDGVGFDPTRLGAATLEGGYGLRALRERLVELGGGLAIESEPGGGTAVSAHLPLPGDALPSGQGTRP
nr:sensor histidine kinase [Propioniciclava soli]